MAKIKRREWKPEHMEQLKELLRSGLPKEDVAANLKRTRPGTTPAAVWSAWVHHNTRSDRRARARARAKRATR